jgi:hypothetical protein
MQLSHTGHPVMVTCELGRTAVLVHSGPNKKGIIGSACRGEKLSEQTSGSPSFGHSVPHFDQMLTKLCFLL